MTITPENAFFGRVPGTFPVAIAGVSANINKVAITIGMDLPISASEREGGNGGWSVSCASVAALSQVNSQPRGDITELLKAWRAGTLAAIDV